MSLYKVVSCVVGGEREKYTQMNVEFQRIASRDKKAFLSE